MKLQFEEIFTQELPADSSKENLPRQVRNACFSYVIPRKPSSPSLVHASYTMMDELRLDVGDEQHEDFINIFSGSKVHNSTKPYAMCYGGHQFGSWAGQLGDGRAINLGRVKGKEDHWALQLKGAGRTPYSRGADGLAVLRSSIREHLCSEAMFNLGVPTTRSLSLMLTGDKVLRDIMYNGNAAYEKGAVVCRVAPSFIRFGNFEIFAARNDEKNLRLLVDYTLRHYYPHVNGKGVEKYIQFFREVSERTLDMVIHWQRVGFVHGVMNTDNMSILGLTIDYGPYGWLEGYEPDWTPNTTDRSHRRYRYGNQPIIALWNLIQLGRSLSLIISDVKPMEDILNKYKADLAEGELNMMRSKLGLKMKERDDKELVESLKEVLQGTEIDMTIFFRQLAEVSNDNIEVGMEKIRQAFYSESESSSESIKASWIEWFRTYMNRLDKEEVDDEERRLGMNKVNPKYVLRNYMAQLAIDRADSGDYSLIDEFYTLLKKPYDDQPNFQKWYAKRPEWARNKVGCSMLSCSS